MLTARGIFLLIFLSLASDIHAQNGKNAGPPPAIVEVSKVVSGSVTPEAEFTGTVYYIMVSEVASEVEGKVEKVSFHEGKRVKRGEVMVRLDSDLLEKKIDATRALHEQVLSELQKARLDMKRADSLMAQGHISEQEYTENKFGMISLEKKAASLSAELESLTIEVDRTGILAPFDGIVIKRQVEPGEWLDKGKSVAALAMDDGLDIVFDIPEDAVRNLKTGMEVTVQSGGKELSGRVFAVIPKGDLQTRTFPVKVRIDGGGGLMEGMEARARFPTGTRRKGFIVPRDALVTRGRDSVVFVVQTGKVRLVTVRILGYSGLKAGVEAEGLEEGMEVVTRGNERLMDGQEVSVSVREVK